MFRYAQAGLVFLVSMMLSASWADENQPQTGISRRISDRIIVRPNSMAAMTDFMAAFEADHPGAVFTGIVDSIPSRMDFLLSVDLPPQYLKDGPDSVQIELELTLNYGIHVVWAEFLYSNEAPEGTTGSTFVDNVVGQNGFLNQFSNNLLGISNAHLRSLGLGTVIAVLDTGVDATHPQLQAQMTNTGFNAFNGGTNTNDVGDGLDTDNDLLTDEMVGHGTFISGLISLVAPEAKILPVKVLDADGISDHWVLTKGLYYAIDQGVEVINLSLGSTYNSQAMEDAIDEAKTKGIVVVAAAGNLNRCDPREFPAMTSTALGVVATDDLDTKASFSNFHNTVFLSAPGANIAGAGPGGLDLARSILSTLPGGTYGTWDGTSMAAPLVTGSAALIRSQHPEWTPDEVSLEKIKDVMIDTSVNINLQNPAYLGTLGAGRLNIAGAVMLGSPTPTPGDLNNDNSVNVTDLLKLLADWGLVHSSADLDLDGIVEISDLLILLTNWN